MSTPVLRAERLRQHYPVGGGLFSQPIMLKAVDDVSFDLHIGETLAVVGESGCGKSTLARMCTLVEEPTEGSLELEGVNAKEAMAADPQRVRSLVQMIFQDPYGSLNPRQKIGTILEEPLRINTKMSAGERRERAQTMLQKVGLRPEHYNRYPHMFSGGQRQRIAIARALMLEPKIVIADEPVSALDISVQAQVLNLLMDLQEEFELAYIFISHDLSVVHHIATKVMVMYLGHAVEQGEADKVFNDPAHPYTQALMAATPAVDPKRRRQRIRLSGELPSPMAPPPGCTFHRRCLYARSDCSEREPHLRPVRGRDVSCHYAEDLGEPDESRAARSAAA